MVCESRFGMASQIAAGAEAFVETDVRLRPGFYLACGERETEDY